MEQSPHRALIKMGVAAHEPALDVLKSWKTQDAETVGLALSVLGPNALSSETDCLKEIISEKVRRIQIGYRKFVAAGKKLEAQAEVKALASGENGDYPTFVKEFSRLSEDHNQDVVILIAALSKLRANERQFVLATLLKFSLQPRVLAKLVPDSFLRADPVWVTDELWKKTKTHPQGEAIGKAMVLGFARARVTSRTWIRSLDFPITSEGDLIWFRRSVRPELRFQLNRRAMEYEAMRKPVSLDPDLDG